MAKFVLAGKADCPYYAKAELFADYLQKNLPNFTVHKIVQDPEAWEQWLMTLCEKNGWKHKKSPIIWRELVDRGGKGLLLGGYNDFMEFAQGYYNVASEMMSAQMKEIASENFKTHIEIQREQEDIENTFNPLHVWITSASIPSCYNLIPLLASGGVFGMDKEIWLHLVDSAHCVDTLQGLVMEAQDLAYPLLRKITLHAITNDAFQQANFIIILDNILSMVDQCPEDYIKMVTCECAQYGALIDQNADKDVKVVVAGSSYVNLKALVISNSAPSINQRNIVALPTQLEFEAKAVMANKLKIQSAAVKDVIVWGNINGIHHLDLREAKVYQYDSALWGPPSFSRPLLSMIYDRKWMKDNLLQEWHKRREHRSGMSAAHCIAKLISWWQKDSNAGEIVSLGVISKGEFDLPTDIVFSMPVRFQDGDWQICKEVPIEEEMKEILLQAANELIKEKRIGMGLPEENQTVSNPTEITIIEHGFTSPLLKQEVENIDNLPENINTYTPTGPPTNSFVEEILRNLTSCQNEVSNLKTNGSFHSGQNTHHALLKKNSQPAIGSQKLVKTVVHRSSEPDTSVHGRVVPSKQSSFFKSVSALKEEISFSHPNTEVEDLFDLPSSGSLYPESLDHDYAELQSFHSDLSYDNIWDYEAKEKDRSRFAPTSYMGSNHPVWQQKKVVPSSWL